MRAGPHRLRIRLRQRLDPRSNGFATLLSVLAVTTAFPLGLFLGPERHGQAFVPSLVLSIGLVVSRDVSLRRGVAAWIVPLDALACFLVVGWTSAPLSEFHFVVLAGAWWAGRLAAPRGATAFAIAFLIPYVLIVLPDGWRRGYLAEAVDDLVTLAVISLLIDWFMAIERRAVGLSAALRSAEGRLESPIEVRRRLALAAGESPVPVDSLVVAGQLGLTGNQIELLGYLLLGFGNAQIADAIGRSEATVRYRLTSLYRALGVGGRRGAVDRARELGIEAWVATAKGRDD